MSSSLENTISKDLAEFLKVKQTTSTSFPKLVRKVLEYVKKNNLVDKEDKNKVIPNEELTKLLKSTKNVTVKNFDTFLSHHYLKKQKDAKSTKSAKAQPEKEKDSGEDDDNKEVNDNKNDSFVATSNKFALLDEDD